MQIVKTIDLINMQHILGGNSMFMQPA